MYVKNQRVAHLTEFTMSFTGDLPDEKVVLIPHEKNSTVGIQIGDWLNMGPRWIRNKINDKSNDVYYVFALGAHTADATINPEDRYYGGIDRIIQGFENGIVPTEPINPILSNISVNGEIQSSWISISNTADYYGMPGSPYFVPENIRDEFYKYGGTTQLLDGIIEDVVNNKRNPGNVLEQVQLYIQGKIPAVTLTTFPGSVSQNENTGVSKVSVVFDSPDNAGLTGGFNSPLDVNSLTLGKTVLPVSDLDYVGGTYTAKPIEEIIKTTPLTEEEKSPTNVKNTYEPENFGYNPNDPKKNVDVDLSKIKDPVTEPKAESKNSFMLFVVGGIILFFILR